MKIPKPTESSRAFFESIVPGDPRVSVRPVFGNPAAFVNGNMFMGLYGEEIFVRLPEEKLNELLKHKGASAFAPMEGHTMKNYIVMPTDWRKKPVLMRSWVEISLKETGKLPPKEKKKQKTSRLKFGQNLSALK